MYWLPLRSAPDYGWPKIRPYWLQQSVAAVILRYWRFMPDRAKVWCFLNADIQQRWL